jgi:CubicO group peptidase (beta-lactamase class C family)
MMSKKTQTPPKPPTVADVARMKSGFAKEKGGSTPPPAYVRRIESAAARVVKKPGA